MTKKCSQCGEVKPLTEYHKQRQAKSGLLPYCKACNSKRSTTWAKNNPDKIKEANKRYRENNPEKYKESYTKYHQTRPSQAPGRRKHKYGISEHDYLKMLEDQNYQCAICGIAFNNTDMKPCVDHDHTIGDVRGLLCNTCNAGLGSFHDNPNHLMKAIQYISSWALLH